MAQIFHRGSNTIARVSLVALPGLVCMGFALLGLLYRSPYFDRRQNPRAQPVPFSHKHHVGDIGVDCRYCHTGVEESAFAGLPPSETCMHCHAQLFADAPILKPVRDSLRDNRSLPWTRINQLPDYVYFDHSVHVHKGVGCVTCHGRVDRMPLTSVQQPLTMKWCLECHNAPERYLRPREEVYNLTWRPPASPETFGKNLVARYAIDKERLRDCSVCHR